MIDNYQLGRYPTYVDRGFTIFKNLGDMGMLGVNPNWWRTIDLSEINFQFLSSSIPNLLIPSAGRSVDNDGWALIGLRRPIDMYADDRQHWEKCLAHGLWIYGLRNDQNRLEQWQTLSDFWRARIQQEREAN